MGERVPIEYRGTFNGTDLCWFEWGEPKAGETSLLLAHATGFHARCWDQVLHRLDQHAVAVELRGHGRSSNDGPFDWHLFGDDLADFVGQGASGQPNCPYRWPHQTNRLYGTNIRG